MAGIIEHNLTRSQLRELEKFADQVVRFGVNFAVCDASGTVLMRRTAGGWAASDGQLVQAARGALESLAASAGFEPAVRQSDDGNLILALPLGSARSTPTGPLAVAIIDLGCRADGDAGSRYLSEMLRLLRENFEQTVESQRQIETVGIELAKVYEELVVLHKLSTNMKVTESDANFLQMACDSLTDVVAVEGIAVILEKTVEGEERLILAAGSGLIDIDDRLSGLLYSRLMDEANQGREALLDSDVCSPFKYDWPAAIRSIIAVPLFGKETADSNLAHRTKHGSCLTGLMVAVNRIDKPDFDSTDIKLFNSVASQCAVFIENGRLFSDLKELFIGSLKALTSSIDAKDQYTRGHSERVAIISRWLAEKLAAGENLKEDQIQRIYLAGLLHDIGKIGIDESVLRKTSKLTSEERECIHRHPAVGANILSGIKQMRDIVPGVLHHHERIDGKGYPCGLSGSDMSLTGKIVGLADSFDAMTSKRTYRDAMTVAQALGEIEKGVGTQFDEKVARVFLSSDIYELWDIIQGGSSEMFPNHTLEYGTDAVGTLIR